MLGRRVAQAWLEVVVSRVSSSSGSSSLLLSQPCTAVSAGLQQLQSSFFYTTSSCSSSQDGGSSRSSSSSTAGFAASSEPAGSSSTSSQSQQAGASPANSFLTVPKRFSDTGYPETFMQAAPQQQAQATASIDNSSSSSSDATAGSSSSEQQQRQSQRLAAGVQLPPEVLRVPLTQQAKQEQAEVTVDAYSLSRSLVGEASPNSSKPFSAAAAAEQQQAGREPLTAADKEALEKLVGILTKDGKKSRARRLLLDAMHIIQQQLAQGKGSA